MQDYSFVAYAVFNEIFDCNKTVLGDINQCIEKIMSSSDLEKLADMLDAEYIENWSLLLDIKLILKTIKVVIMKTGSK